MYNKMYILMYFTYFTGICVSYKWYFVECIFLHGPSSDFSKKNRICATTFLCKDSVAMMSSI